MENVLSLFAEHGLLALFASVLVEQLGAPVPALPFLLLAGVSAAGDGVYLVEALAVASLASMLADSLWFYAGRRYGRQVLALLCRISISPDSCVRQSELDFARRGRATLLVAKFVPGLSTLASPLAGAIGMRAASFALFNLAGTLLWAGSGIVAGVLFHDQVAGVLDALRDFGGAALAVVVGVLALYIAARAWRRRQLARAVAKLPRVEPAELAAAIESGEELILVDVRGALTPASPAGRIPGAQHIDLARVGTVSLAAWSDKARIVAYCACPDDASAQKAARLLGKRGLRVSVLHGGVDGWVAAGYPLAADLATG